MEKLMEDSTNSAAFNWQKVSRTNVLYAKLVTLTYLGMCFGIGFCIDVLINYFWYGLKFWDSVWAIVWLKQLPIGIPIMVVGGALLLIGLYLFQRKIMLNGLNAHRIDAKEKSLSEQEQSLLNIFNNMAKSIGLSKIPTLYVSDSPVLNAMASGSRQNKSYVVITQGLIDNLSMKQCQAVMATQLCHIKLSDQRLSLAVAMVSHVGLIFFDLFFHRFMYVKEHPQDGNPLVDLFLKGLRISRFIIPAGSFLIRFFLSPERLYLTQQMTVKMMGENETLATALIKIYDYQFEHIEAMGEAYSKQAFDEIRRESYLFDPADVNKAQTFATPFTTHPTLDEQLETINYTREVKDEHHNG